MKKILFPLLLLSVIFFVSCQKEIDWGPGGSSTTLLVKVVQKTGTDSVTINYSYDAAKRLIEEKTTGITQGIDADNDLRIVRNSSGIITQTVQKAAALISAGIDSVVTVYNYNTSSSRYTSSVFGVTLFGFTVLDSAAYGYDASGNISSEEHYQSFFGSPYLLSFKQEYTYSASGNVLSVMLSSYDATTSSYDLISTLNYLYDNKINPLKINKEAIILTRRALFNVNNAIQYQFADATDPANNFIDIVVYTYDSNNKPKTAVDTKTPPGTVSDITYYYQ